MDDSSHFELKISPTREDDPSSTFELHLLKTTSTHSFFSDETNSMFLLTAKLPGFARDDIVITINGSGTRIEISWGQPVQKMEITRWTYKKETETRRFKKIFRIPDGVILDEIKATYNDEKSILKILMPKLEEGILGVGIQEVKEKEAGEATFESQDSEAEAIPHTPTDLETPETGKETKLIEDTHGNGEFGGENAKREAFSKMEYAAETTPEEIEKLKGNEMEDTDGGSNDYSECEQLETGATKATEYEGTKENMNGQIKVPKVTSMEGIEVAEGTSQETANHQEEKGEGKAEEHNGDIATMIKKKLDVKTQPQASIDQEAQTLEQENFKRNRHTRAELGKLETYRNTRELKEPEDIEIPYLQSPAHEHEEKEISDEKKTTQSGHTTKVKTGRDEVRFQVMGMSKQGHIFLSQ
ncbi:neurofilament medium polypeptide-like [Cucurbita moschata]|uniref:Neurofilament medium polypeptide-like n=1 Tax=Cucurbita moschata TaxID=3662 RepID=A0A6J1EKH3_CUCMO|nr:neurofilament medium polypeptide-like [Cucurbita moschata]